MDSSNHERQPSNSSKVLIKLLAFGQSYWLDNLTRGKITSGELKNRVEQQGLRGITSNPSIFNKAISSGHDYDDQIESLVRQGKSAYEIYDHLTIKDVQDACDILLPVYRQSDGVDGYVSLEVSPYLARDTEGTLKEARRLFMKVARPNCFIKVPGTAEGIPAIEQLLYEGININITLLFSIKRYSEIAQSYIRAIQRRVSEGKAVDRVFSVASVFLSRIDVLADQLLSQQIIPEEGGHANNAPEKLFGKAGLATARLAYQRFVEIFSGEQWKTIEKKGAHVQRPLWASTSNKDPLYHDLRYVEPLIGKDTVNTLPDETIAALAEHGIISKDSISQGLEEAQSLFASLKNGGVDIDFVTRQLENEGIEKFTEAYDSLISNLADKRIKLLADKVSSQQISIGKWESEFRATSSSLEQKQIPGLLFAKNPNLWTSDPEQVKEISQRLGWLSLPDLYLDHTDDLINFALKVKQEGFRYAVLLGMGGSSLCSEVARETFGTTKGFLSLYVLDDTAPESIRDLESKIELEKTLFIVASKSGNTKETLSFFQYFHHELEKKKKSNPGENFVAITDKGTPLVKLGEQYQFRKIFLNPPDLGGRYSVLSDFGLVPMALMGVDLHAFLAAAMNMEKSCDAIPVAVNPGISLGVALGLGYRHGCDKVTFILSSSIRSFGYWVEQLIAESTGKEGRGLIPVHGEETGTPDSYGSDRFFVHIYLATDQNEKDIRHVKALEAAGHPVVRIALADKFALGGEYYRWEVAVAIAGMIIHINPFDQPNVEESKKNTDRLLEGWSASGSFDVKELIFSDENISIYGRIGNQTPPNEYHEVASAVINRFFTEANQGDYVAILPYFMLTDDRLRILQAWRQEMREKFKVATTLLNGPRYLHSTGQLHKGGPDTGLFILLTGDEQEEVVIPGSPYGFDILHQAQALGDFRSLEDKGRRVIRIHFNKDLDVSLKRWYQAVSASHAHALAEDIK